MASETFTLRATRFNYRALEDGVRRTAERLGLRSWISVGEGRLRRDLTVTVVGDPEAIAELMAYIESVPAQAGDAGGPM